MDDPYKRGSDGRFGRGNKGGPGRPKLPPGWKKAAAGSLGRMMDLIDDPDTPAAVRMNGLQFIAQMFYGKPTQQVYMDADVQATVDPVTLDDLQQIINDIGSAAD